MPLLYRDAPLNSIWEGSGNVAALDVLRAMVKEPEGLPAFLAECELAAGADPRLDAHLARVARARPRRRSPASDPPVRRRGGVVEDLARRAAGVAAGPPRAAGGRRRVLRGAARRRGRPRVRHASGRASTPGRSSSARCRHERRRVTRSTGRVARITLNRPERGNGITRGAARPSSSGCVERADLDPAVHVIAAGRQRQGLLRRLRPGRERRGAGRVADGRRGAPPGSPLDPAVMAANHDPRGTWDPMVDYAMMSRNVRGFMSLFHCSKPVVCKVHGFCVAGGTDMALCSDLLVIAADAKIGYPPARVWGSPTTAMWALPARAAARQAAAVHRRLAVGRRGAGVGAGDRGAAARASSTSATEALVGADRADAAQPAADDEAARQPVAVRAGPARDADARHRVRRHRPPHRARATRSQGRPPREGFRAAVRERDEPFGDLGPSTFKG